MENKKSSPILSSLLSVIKFCLVATFLIYKKKNPDNPDGSLISLTRNANINDLLIEQDNDFSLSIKCYITPNSDIKDLELTFTFYDKKMLLQQKLSK